MAAPAITHADAADGTFSSTGATNWNKAHTLANFSAASKLLGAGSAAATPQEIAIGSNLTMTGNTLSASAGSNSGPTFPGGIPMTGVKYRSAWGSAIATGDNDLVFTETGTATVPAGKRWMIANLLSLNNSGVGNIGVFAQIKIGGTYYRVSSTSTIANQGVASQPIGYIAEAGETLSVNTVTNNGLNVIAQIIEFDNSIGIFSSKITSLSIGNNTVYTVTAGKTALPLQGSGAIFTLAGVGGVALNYINSSGGARTISWNIVPSGGVVGSGNLFVVGASVADNTKKTDACAPTLSAGDFINIATDAATATQWAWVNVMEI